jgi:hypothetical protein
MQKILHCNRNRHVRFVECTEQLDSLGAVHVVQSARAWPLRGGTIGERDVRALWESWMVQPDRLLDDEELIDRVYFAQGERHEHSATRGSVADACRDAAAADAAQAHAQLELRRAGARDADEPGHRDFTRIGRAKVPDAKTLARIAQALGCAGRRRNPRAKFRVDTTVADQHSLPHRFELAGRWRARADAHDDEDRNRGGQAERWKPTSAC